MKGKRALSDIIKKRLAEPNPLIQVVVGPRQVGKTTALRSALDGRGVTDLPIIPCHFNPTW